MLSSLKKIGSVSKKIFLVLFTFALIVSLFTTFTQKSAPEQPNQISIQEYNRKRIYAFINQEENKTEEGKAMVAVYRTMMCFSVGEACTDNPADGDKKFNDSIFGGLGNLLTFTFVNPPASGVEYVYNGLQKSGFIPQAYAAEGVGFASVKPLLPIWKIFRDIAYLVIVIVMVAIGFMIMFRMKLDSQTAIGIQNSLPKIVISLILITFSFAIAGFLIDLMYLIMAICISALASPNEVGALQNQYLGATPATIIDGAIAVDEVIPGEVMEIVVPGWSKFIDIWPLPFKFGSTLLTVGGTAYSLLSILPSIVSTLLALVGGVGTIILAEKLVSLFREVTGITTGIGALTFNLGGLVSGGLNTIVIIVVFIIGFIFAVPLIMMLLIFFTVLFLFFRVFFMLFTSYLKILLLIIFAPLYMLLEALPGQEAASQWFKNLFGELMSFPIVAILLIVANKLGTTILQTIIVNTATDLTNLSNAKQFFSPPFLYGLNQEAYAFLVGMGIVFLIPDLVKAFKDMIGVKEMGIKFGLSTFLAGGTVAVGGGVGLLTQFSSIQQAITGDNTGLLGALSRLRGSRPEVPGVTRDARTGSGEGGAG